MVSPANTTIICPNNDLESRTILEIGKKLGMDVRESTQPWGARLGTEPESNRHELLRDLKENVVVVEMPDPEEEARLTRKGHNIFWIDHHQSTKNGMHLDRTNPRSSLEQFAELIGYELDEHEKLVACNDRGSYWAMAGETAGTLEQMLRIVEQDLHAQGYTEAEKQQAVREYEQAVTFNASAGDCFCLVITTLKSSSYLAHLHQQPSASELAESRKKGKPLPVRAILVLNLDSGCSEVRKVSFYGPRAFLPKLNVVESSLSGQGLGYEFWRGGGGASPACFWGGQRGREGEPVWSCDDLANAILRELIVYDRPLLKYSTVFFYPFKVTGPDKTITGPWVLSNFEIKDRSYQEYVYFHPYARKILYSPAPPSSGDPGSSPHAYGRGQGDQPNAVEYFEFKPLQSGDRDAGLEISVTERFWVEDRRVERERIIRYPVEHMAIHSFLKHSRLCILAIQVTQSVTFQELMEHPCVREAMTSAEIQDDAKFLENLDRKVSFWRLCTARDYFDRKHLTTYDALLFNELARKTYLSFTEQLEEGDISKIPTRVTLAIKEQPPLTHVFTQDQLKLSWHDRENVGVPQISHIIQGLVQGSLQSGCFLPILDDRMVVHTFLGFAGWEPRTSLAKDDQESLFHRIMYVEGPGTGFCYDPEFIRGQSQHLIYRRWYNCGNLYGFTRYSSAYSGYGGFFSNVIFHHFNSMYYQLAIIALFYRISLIQFSDDVADATKKLKRENPDREAFIDLKHDFMRFSNIYWFQEVTNQDEGIEIFDLYKKSFQFDSMYNQVKEEIDRADQFLELLDSRRYNILSKYISGGALIFAVLAVLTGYFGMNFNEIPLLEQYLFSNLTTFWSVTTFVIISILISIILIFIYVVEKQHKNK